MALAKQSCRPLRPHDGAADVTSVEYILWTFKGYANACFDNGTWSVRTTDNTHKSVQKSGVSQILALEDARMAFDWLRQSDIERGTRVLSSFGSSARALLQQEALVLCGALLEIANEPGEEVREYNKVLTLGRNAMPLQAACAEGLTLYGRWLFSNPQVWWYCIGPFYSRWTVLGNTQHQMSKEEG